MSVVAETRRSTNGSWPMSGSVFARNRSRTKASLALFCERNVNGESLFFWMSSTREVRPERREREHKREDGPMSHFTLHVNGALMEI